MKNSLYLFGLAFLALTGCTQNEVLDVPQQEQIGFDSFVGKETRAVEPIASRNALTNFYVFGDNGNVALLFDEVEVLWNPTKNHYEYNEHKTWEVGKTYKFAAYSDGNHELTGVTYNVTDENNQLEFESYAVNDERDLIAAILQPYDIQSASDIPSGRLVFPFKHLLSRVRFEFENSAPATSPIAIKVNNVDVSGVTTGNCVYTLAGNCSWTGLNNGTYNFGDIDVLAPGQTQTLEKFVIPQSNDIDVVITVDTYRKNALTDAWEKDESPDASKEYTIDLSYTHKEVKKWHEGWVYTYLIKTTSETAYIHFDAAVEDWKYDLDGNGDNGTNDDIDKKLN